MKTKLERCEPNEKTEIENQTNAHGRKISLEELLADLPEGCEIVTDALSAHEQGVQLAS